MDPVMKDPAVIENLAKWLVEESERRLGDVYFLRTQVDEAFKKYLQAKDRYERFARAFNLNDDNHAYGQHGLLCQECKRFYEKKFYEDHP